MVKKIIMPSGGQTTDEMLIQKWNFKQGDPVKIGDVLFEIETDKASMPVESFTDGILLAILYNEGEMVKTGEIVAYIGDQGDKIPAESEKPMAVPEEMKIETSVIQDKAVSPVIITGVPQQIKDLKITASPLAKNIARIENISLDNIASYYSKNLIKKADIDNYIRDKKAVGADENYYMQDITPIRRAIAKRMKESVLTTPHYTVSIDVDMTDITALRKKLNVYLNEGEFKITYNDILMKVAARAIELFPLINSSYREDKIKIFRDVNFGLAVSLDKGLVVPVVKQVNKKSIREIAAANYKNVTAAKTNSLRESDITGGTITLSNLGMFGINNFGAVINQPESCILAVGGIIEKPVAKSHQIVIREMMNITASFDHRIIDGTLGAAFLSRIRELLEDPYLLFINPEKYLSEK